MTTPTPLVWDFYNTIGVVDGLGGAAHYYDNDAQQLYLNDGLATRITQIEEGHWEDAIFEDELLINEDPYTKLVLDHPSFGVLYGVATNGTSLTFLRYIYSMDISDLMDAWSWMSMRDSPVNQFSASVRNLGPDIFSFNASLFQPGAKVTVSIKMGDSAPYPLGVAWLDECSYDIQAETVEISGRNTIGYYLKDQTFDDEYEMTGISSDIMTAILTFAGLTKFVVQTGDGTLPFTFLPTDTLLDGIELMLSAYTNSNNEWKLVEGPDGTIYVGYEFWLGNILPNTYYSFNEGSDVFKRKTSKVADSSYTSVRVTGRDASDEDLLPVIIPVTNFQYWALGAHKTLHLRAPDGFTQEQLQAWAEAQAEMYQYIGIGEDFTGPFRPNLLVGDVAEVVEGEIGTSLGVITEVRQTFMKTDGFRTDFSVDSGGVYTDGENYTIYSRAADVNGFNRRQTITDLIRYISKK